MIGRPRKTIAVTVVAAAIGFAWMPVNAIAERSSSPAQQPTAVAQWLASQRAAISAAGGHMLGPDTQTSGFQASPAQGASLAVAGHFAGPSRLRDLLDIRQVSGSGDYYNIGISARDPRNGNELWHADVFETGSDEFADFPMRLGPDHAPGVLVMTADYSAGANSTDPSTVDERFIAISGTGGLAWSKTFTGQYMDNTDSSDLPAFQGILQDGPGRPARVLVSLQSITGSSMSGEAKTVSVEHGHVARLGPTVTSKTISPVFTPIPDITGDGRDDVIVSRGGTARLLAINGVSGHQIWRSKPLQHSFSTPTPTTFFAGEHQVTAFLDRDSLYGPFPIVAISDSDGKVLWTKMADSTFAVGRAGPKHLPSIGLEKSTTQALTHHLRSRMTVWAVNEAGHQVWRHVITAQVPGNTTSSYEYADTVAPAGQVLADGSTDAITHVFIGNLSGLIMFSNAKELTGIIDGSTGKLRSGPYQIATGGSLSGGPGKDLAQVTIDASSQADLTASVGTTGKQYFRQPMTGYSDVAEMSVASAPVTGHGCPDFIVTSEDPSGSELTDGVFSAGGQSLWSLAFTTSDTSGGTLTNSTPPAKFCA